MPDATCLILGANGFIGSHLCDNLSLRGYRVIAFDRFSEPARFNSSNGISLFKGDLFDDESVGRALTGADYVFHAFSATSPFTADAEPSQDVDVNLRRAVGIFQMCAFAGVRKVVYISSGGAVYGTAAESQVVTEETKPEPVSPYGICKLAAEHYLGYFERKFGLSHVIFRLTNPYGPRQVLKHNQGFIASVVHNAAFGQDTKVFGDGSMSRDFVYIGDVVDMVTGTFENCSESLYNIGAGYQTDLRTVISTIGGLLGKELGVSYLEAPKTFLQQTQVSISKFEGEFGRRQFTTLEDGLRATLLSNGMLPGAAGGGIE